MQDFSKRVSLRCRCISVYFKDIIVKRSMSFLGGACCPRIFFWDFSCLKLNLVVFLMVCQDEILAEY